MADQAIGKLNVILQAKADKYSKVMTKSIKQVDALDNRVQTAGANLKSFGKRILGMVVVGGAIAMTRSIMDSMDKIAKLSRRSKIATEELVKLGHAAELSGLGMDAMNLSLEKMMRNISLAVTDGGRLEDVFTDMGIKVDELNQMSTSDAFLRIAKGVGSLTGQNQKLATMFDIFGRGGAKMLNVLEQGESGLRAMMEEAERLGMTFSAIDAKRVEDANDSVTRLKASFRALLQTAIIKLAPILDSLANSIAFLIANPITRWVLGLSAAVVILIYSWKGLLALKGLMFALFAGLKIKAISASVAILAQAQAYNVLAVAQIRASGSLAVGAAATVRTASLWSRLGGVLLKVGLFLKGIVLGALKLVSAALAAIGVVVLVVIAAVAILVGGLIYFNKIGKKYEAQSEAIIKASNDFANALLRVEQAKGAAAAASAANDFEAEVTALRDQKKALLEAAAAATEGQPEVRKWHEAILGIGMSAEKVAALVKVGENAEKVFKNNAATLEEQILKVTELGIAYDKLHKVLDPINKTLSEQLDLIQLGTEAYARKKLAAAGATKEQMANIQFLQDMLRATGAQKGMRELNADLEDQIKYFGLAADEAKVLRLEAQMMAGLKGREGDTLGVAMIKEMNAELEKMRNLSQRLEFEKMGEAIGGQLQMVQTEMDGLGKTAGAIFLESMAGQMESMSGIEQSLLGIQMKELEEAMKRLGQMQTFENMAADMRATNAELEKQIALHGKSSHQQQMMEIATLEAQVSNLPLEQQAELLAMLEQRKTMLKELKSMEEKTALMTEGAALTEQMMSPIEKYEEQIGKLNELLDGKAIDFETYSRAVQDAREKLESAEGGGTDAGSFKTIRTAYMDISGMAGDNKEQRRTNEILVEIRDQEGLG